MTNENFIKIPETIIVDLQANLNQIQTLESNVLLILKTYLNSLDMNPDEWSVNLSNFTLSKQENKENNDNNSELDESVDNN